MKEIENLNESMEIERIAKHSIEELTKLTLELWPDCSYKEEYEHCQRILESENETCFLAKEEGEFIAFIHLALRLDYVEGTTTSPVAYIEGLYVKPGYRKSGVASNLVAIGETWGKNMGCKQYASDTECENKQSIAFHKKAGFMEVNRVVCFVKDIKDSR